MPIHDRGAARYSGCCVPAVRVPIGPPREATRRGGVRPLGIAGARSWTVTRAEIEARGYDLKAVNPTAKVAGDTRTPIELLDEIEARGREVDGAVTRLRTLLGADADR